MNLDQYNLISARRQHQDNLVWQTPPLATAALAFLLAAALDHDTTPTNSLVLSGFSFFVALASMQLMAKHRHLEIADADLLLDFEKSNESAGFSPLHGPRRGKKRSWFVAISSFWLWIWVLGGFCLIAVYSATLAYSKIQPDQFLAIVHWFATKISAIN